VDFNDYNTLVEYTTCHSSAKPNHPQLSYWSINQFCACFMGGGFLSASFQSWGATYSKFGDGIGQACSQP